MKKEYDVLRRLASEVMEIANSPEQMRRRDAWRSHNSKKPGPPLIYLRAFAFDEFFDENSLVNSNPLLRWAEKELHLAKFRSALGDDFIVEPWLAADAVYDPPAEEKWGVYAGLGEKPSTGGAAAYLPQIVEEEDISLLKTPSHKVNKEATQRKQELLQEALDGIMPVQISRCGPFFMWGADLSTDLAKLRGLEQIMWDAYDRPEWLHRLLSFMRDSVLKVQREVEESGDYALADHQNQCMPYAEELRDPAAGVYGVGRKELWCFAAAQEFTTFGPDMFREFMLEYQIPIMAQYGLSAYGCCEDLTQKIDLLREIPNLRRIAVSPFANAQKCAEQIGKDYILSWRPNPSLMLATGLDEEFVRQHMRHHFDIFKQNGNLFDITLKDVETVNHQPQNIARWTQVVREEILRAF